MQRLPEPEHDVVRHVDGERDRAHPGQLQPPAQPSRRRARRVEVAHDPGHVAVAPLDAVNRGGVLQPHRVALRRRRRHVEQRGVAEAGTGGVGVLPGDAAHAQRVPAVRGDVDLDRLVVQPQQADRVGAGLGVAQPPFGEPDDAGVVVTEVQLPGGADHAVGDVPVGLARADLEAAGQHGPGQRDHHRITGGEVARAADDPAGLLLAHVDEAPADRLAVALRLVREVQHAADHQRAEHVAAVHGLLLQTDPRQVGGNVLGRHPARIRWRRDVLAQPRQGDPHQASIPNCRLNRTSPSTMSRMSSMPWRTCRVRSRPIPKAKPV
jgi:hypothetical protein